MTRKGTVAPPALVQGRVITEIVAPITTKSFYERGASLAASLGESWGIPIRLVHVEAAMGSVDLGLEDAVDRLRKLHPNLVVNHSHLYGDDVARAVADFARPDVLLTVASEHANEWAVKGSVAEGVVRSAGAPILMFGHNATSLTLTGDVVAGFDGSVASEAALEPALGLAASLDSRLWVVQVVPVATAEDQTQHISPPLVQRVAERLDSAGSVGWEIIQHNDPVAAIDNFANARGAGFVVAATRGRSATHHYMGSVTMGLVQISSRPVLVVKAPDVPELTDG